MPYQVSKRVQLIAVLLAGFLATGAQWDFVQVFGWGRMIVKYAQNMPLDQAVKRTFSGEMCGVCEAVSEAKQQEAPTDLPSKGKFDGKMLLVLSPASNCFVVAIEQEAWSPRDVTVFSTERSAPPLPPPRV